MLYLALPVSGLSLLLTMTFAIGPLRKSINYLSTQFNSLLDNKAPEIFDVQYQKTACNEELVGLCTSAENLWQTARTTKSQLEMLQNVYESSLDAIIITQLSDNRIVDCNPKARFMLGYSKEELTRHKLDKLTRYDNGRVNDSRKQILEKGYAWSDEMILLTKAKKRLPVEVSSSPLEIDGEKFLVSFIRDITDRKAAENRISHLAYHDSLTDLPNRTLLTDRINRAILKAKRGDSSGAVMFLDLDKFKRINDSLGHDIGDDLLIQVARRLKDALREMDTIARLGGDEFVVMIENISGHENLVKLEIKQIAEKLRDQLAIPYQLGDHHLQVTSSIGVTIFPLQGDKVDDLLRKADTAMYYAKKAGRDQVEFFHPAMEEATINRLELENHIRLALDSGQFKVFFQPILSTLDQKIVGAEALIRWLHPENGIITPSDFISTLENSRLLMRIDDWVLQESVKLANELSSNALNGGFNTISINISSIQFHQPLFLDKVRKILEAGHASPEILQFEVTEPTIQQDIDDSILKFNQLKQLGIRMAVDRFGTGYSSMSWLKKLPLDTLKLDRTFTAGIGNDPSDEVIIDTALSMARHMGIEVIAEGVETQFQLDFLREKHCKFYQGYLASGAVPVEEFLLMCESGRASTGPDSLAQPTL